MTVNYASTWETTYFGARLRCNDVDVIQRHIATYGVWEPDVSHVIERRLRRGDVFVDVGANIGYHSLLAASRVGPTGKVVAIEPNLSTNELLWGNIQANLHDNIRPVSVAISDRCQELQLYEYGPTNTGAVTTRPDRRMFRDGDPNQAFTGSPMGTVDALPLIDALLPVERFRTRLIKIDVEGGEGPIVQDILRHLDSWPRDMEIIVEVDPELADWDGILGWLTSEDFSAYRIENDYSAARYRRWQQSEPLVLVDEVPTEQVDLLLTRHM